jgi:hypothetical protein
MNIVVRNFVLILSCFILSQLLYIIFPCMQIHLTLRAEYASYNIVFVLPLIWFPLNATFEFQIK